MELIVAVYDDWGIGRDGTQPVALKADRKFFRETTKGCLVIAGRRTVEDFPGKKPLPGRENLLLTRQGGDYPGFTLCQSVEQAVELAEKADRAMVIGGGSVVVKDIPDNSVAVGNPCHVIRAITDEDKKTCWSR